MFPKFKHLSIKGLLLFAALLAVIFASVLAVLFFVLGLAKELPAVDPNTSFAASGTAADPDSVDGGSEGTAAKAPAVKEWSFPILSAVTGTDASSGQAAAWGLDYGIQGLNENGGIRGMPVKSIVKDTSGNPDKALSEMRNIAQGAIAVFGPAGNQEFEDAHQEAVDTGIPNIGYATSEEIRGQFAPFVISCTAEPGNDAELAVQAWLAQNPEITSLCILYDSSSPAATARMEKASDYVRSLGAQVELAANIEVKEGFDAEAVAKSALESEADAYYIETGAEAFVSLAAQLRAADVPEGRILGGNEAAATALFEYASASDPAVDLSGVNLWSLSDPKGIRSWAVFEQASRERIDPDYLETAADYYEAVNLVALGIETLELTGDMMQVGSEREKLAEWLYNTGEITSPRGTYRIVDGEKIVTPHLLKIQNGAFVLNE
ncbi:MAG: ABC transporter substrate-binding protein [Clostridiales Family XIII bacterium]|jgi:ABC-type branched-subunit amino acid transport system substrate-binding protein|nr:ABC transporter substrate-binding protein [Clostridiales Family XIII bacterium]